MIPWWFIFAMLALAFGVYDYFNFRFAFRKGYELGVRDAAPAHKANQCGSGTWCNVCGKSWDTNDNRPPLCYKPSLTAPKRARP